MPSICTTLLPKYIPGLRRSSKYLLRRSAPRNVDRRIPGIARHFGYPPLAVVGNVAVVGELQILHMHADRESGDANASGPRKDGSRVSAGAGPTPEMQ